MSAPISKTITGTLVPLKVGTGGKIVGIQAFGTVAAYLQLFDAAKASDVTVGTTAPTLSLGIGANVPFVIPPGQIGWDFTLGIFAAATTARANSTTATLDCNFAIDIP